MLLFTDSFEGYGRGAAATPSPSNVLLRRYTAETGGHTQRPRARGDGRCLYATDGFTIDTVSTDATRIVGFEWYQNSVASDGILVLFRETSSSSSHARLIVNLQGHLQVYGVATIVGTGTTRIRANRWNYVEMKVVVANGTGGSIEVRLNGQVEISVSGIDTQNTAGAYGRFLNFLPQDPVGWSRGIANIYVCDSTGSYNNDFLGPCRCRSITPNAEGATITWTPSAGSDNALMIDDTTAGAADDDTTYVSAVTSGDRDLYGYTDLSVTDPVIFGINGIVDARVTTVSPESICQVANSNGTIAVQTAKSITSTSYSRRQDILEVDPDTSDPWTLAAVNALEFGFEID